MTANVNILRIREVSGRRIFIEDVYPSIDAGHFPVKRIVGEPVHVWADIFRDGHAVLAAELLWRPATAGTWSGVAMLHYGNDRWTASFTPVHAGRYVYAIEAWTDEFATWRRDFLLKREAGLDVTLEAEEGRLLLAELKTADRRQAFCKEGEDLATLLSSEFVAVKCRRADLTRSNAFPLMVERTLAQAGAWYEMMPRSQGRVARQHGTFDDCIARLPDIAALGFDVLYLTPIHPIGHTNRKGRNNSLSAVAGDPGSPYAIGSAQGGHDAINPELGTFADFERLVTASAEQGL